MEYIEKMLITKSGLGNVVGSRAKIVKNVNGLYCSFLHRPKKNQKGLTLYCSLTLFVFLLFFLPLPQKETKRSSAVPSSPPATLLASPLKELARWAQTAFSGFLGCKERGPGVEAKALATSR